MKLRILYESEIKNNQNILLLVHPNYIIDKYGDKYDWAKEKVKQYLDELIFTIKRRISQNWIVIVSFMPLWGGKSSAIFQDMIRIFKSNPNFYFVDDSRIFGTDTIKNKTGLCGDSKVIDLILNSENITVEIGGGYASSCVARTLETFGGEDFLRELGITLNYNDTLLFDYDVRK